MRHFLTFALLLVSFAAMADSVTQSWAVVSRTDTETTPTVVVKVSDVVPKVSSVAPKATQKSTTKKTVVRHLPEAQIDYITGGSAKPVKKNPPFVMLLR